MKRITKNQRSLHVQWRGLFNFFMFCFLIYPPSLLAQETIPSENIHPTPHDSSSDTHSIILVSNALEFLQAIGSDRHIIIKTPENLALQLDEVDLSLVETSDSLLINKTQDGIEFIIRNVNNLTLEGTLNENGERTKIYNRFASANVLTFGESKNITIKNLAFGHSPHTNGSPETINSTGNALSFYAVSDVKMQNLDLFGSGAYGLHMIDTTNIQMEDSIIRESTFGILVAAGKNEITFNRMVFKENKEFGMFVFYDVSGRLTLNNSTFVNNIINEEHHYVFDFSSNHDSETSLINIELNNITFNGNQFHQLVNDAYKERIILNNTFFP